MYCNYVIESSSCSVQASIQIRNLPRIYIGVAIP